MAVRRFVLGVAVILLADWSPVSQAPQDPPQQTLPAAPVVPPQKPRTPTPAAPDPTPQAAPVPDPAPPEQEPERRAQQKSIEMPYHGLAYSMLAKVGVTVMVAQLSRSILEY